MGMKTAWHRLLALTAAVALASAASAPAQEHKPAAEQKRGSKLPPAHAPHPELPPALALHHLRQGNEAAVQARADKAPEPKPRPRPAGAGRYLCAVLTCADADLDVAALFGLRRQDVLVISKPGPFVDAEATALLEHCITEERLTMVVILTHADCVTAAIEPGANPRQNALAARIAAARQRAKAAGHSLPRALARSQRELLLASSPVVQQSANKDEVRIIAAEVNPATLAITWHTHSAEELPMPVVR
jgi:carbonic anhydrase